MGFTTLFCDSLSNLDEIKRPLNGIGLNRGPGTDIVVITAVVIYEDSFSLLYANELRCLFEKVAETLSEKFKYVFYV